MAISIRQDRSILASTLFRRLVLVASLLWCTPRLIVRLFQFEFSTSGSCDGVPIETFPIENKIYDRSAENRRNDRSSASMTSVLTSPDISEAYDDRSSALFKSDPTGTDISEAYDDRSSASFKSDPTGTDISEAYDDRSSASFESDQTGTDISETYSQVVRGKLSTTYGWLDVWLTTNTRTPGARLVRLLRKIMYNTPGAEAERMKSCISQHKGKCLGGMNFEFGKSIHEVHVPFTNRTVAEVSHYKFNGQPISYVGSMSACIPLITAARAVAGFGTVVELGPLAGFTSRCLGLGLVGTNTQFLSFDRYEGKKSWNSILKETPWLEEDEAFKNRGGREGDYLWLWERAMEDVYPTAKGVKGFVNGKALKPSVFKKKKVALLSISSIPSWDLWQHRLSGLKPYFLVKGSILVLREFLSVTQLPTIIYACLSSYLQPVYIEWDTLNTWIMVALDDIPADKPRKCFHELLKGKSVPDASEIRRMGQQLKEDLDFCGDKTMTGMKDRTFQKIFSQSLARDEAVWKAFLNSTV